MSSLTLNTGEIEILRDSVRTTQQVVRMNTLDITHNESLVQPQPAGNCLNWVLGHILCVYNEVLPLVHQQPIMEKEALKQYKRGSAPLTNASDALPLTQLLAGLDQAAQRLEAGVSALSAEQLDAKAPVSPRNDPNETVRSMLALVSFHQAYHAGQLGILRRLVGKKGAIA